MLSTDDEKHCKQLLRQTVESFASHRRSLVCSVFFARYWRQWIVCCKKYSLETNHISLNSYICIELNAHALILLLMLLRDKSKSTGVG